MVEGRGRGRSRSKTHEISPGGSDVEQSPSKEKSGGLSDVALSAVQLQQIAAVVSGIMNAKQMTSAPKVDSDHEDAEEEGEVKEPDEVDKYDTQIAELIGDQLKVGPELSERVIKPLAKCIGSPLDAKVIKEKRDLYPRPANVENLKVPRLNHAVFSKASKEHQFSDRELQAIQSYVVAAISAVASQAEAALKLRKWFLGLDDDDKGKLLEEFANLGLMYVTLMDANLLLTRGMFDMTSLRRKVLKNDLVEPYKSLMDDDKNPPSPAWLAGEDVHAAMKKVRDEAQLADKIAKKSSFQGKDNNKGGNKGQGRFHPYRDDRRGDRDQYRGKGRGKGNFQRDSQSAPNNFDRGDRRNDRSDRRDFQHRDTR